MKIELRGYHGIIICTIERANNFFEQISTSPCFKPGKNASFEDKQGNVYYADVYHCTKETELEFDSGLTKVKMYPTYYAKIIV